MSIQYPVLHQGIFAFEFNTERAVFAGNWFRL